MASKFTTYVVPIDFTSTTENALRFALDISQGQNAHIILLHIVSQPVERIAAQQQLHQMIEKYATPENHLEYRVVTGKVLSDIGIIAESIDAKLIVMGTHDITIMGKIFGSKALEVVKNSKVPLILIQDGSNASSIKHIAMTIDLQRESIQVVKTAATIGKLFRSKVTLVGQRFEDSLLQKKIEINTKIATDYLRQHGLETTISMLPESHFETELIQFCKENGVDLLAATYYEETFRLFSSNLVSSLSHNELKIPVMTFDGEDTSSGSQFGFITQ
jgi:nucleotide-binding universal stress UspA family protein